MECADHPGVTASNPCLRCDRPICASCVTEVDGRTFCPECAEFLAQRGRPPSARPAPAPTVPQGAPLPTAAAQMYGGDVSGGSTGPGEVYGGDVYTGEVTAGPPDSGGLYQPAPAPRSGGSGTGAAVASAEGSLGRALLFGCAAALLSALVWYGIATWTGRELAIVALGIGPLVGIATAAGHGRGGSDVALLSVGIFLIAIVAGEYMIQNSFHREMRELDQAVDAIERDGDYTEEEIATLLGYTASEWQQLTADERAENVAYFEEYQDEYDDGYNDGPADGEPVPEVTSSLPVGEFLAFLPFSLGIMGWIFVAIGGYEAWKIPMNAG